MLTIFSGPHPLGGLRTVACPSWDGTQCACPRMVDGSVPDHLEHRWSAQQDVTVSIREARLLAEAHYGAPAAPKHGSLVGVIAVA